MAKAYGWAFVSPVRKIYYNITTTGLSIFVVKARDTSCPGQLVRLELAVALAAGVPAVQLGRAQSGDVHLGFSPDDGRAGVHRTAQ